MTDENPSNLWKEIICSWDGAQGYYAENKAGAVLLMGQDREGKDGTSPMELLLAGLAGCTAIDIIDILKKKRQLPAGFKVVVRGNRKMDTYPKIYTEFQVEYLLWGENLIEKDVQHAITLSEEKYCSVGLTLAKAAPIHSTYRIYRSGEKPD